MQTGSPKEDSMITDFQVLYSTLLTSPTHIDTHCTDLF